jgi:hypothetical protein
MEPVSEVTLPVIFEYSKTVTLPELVLTLPTNRVGFALLELLRTTFPLPVLRLPVTTLEVSRTMSPEIVVKLPLSTAAFAREIPPPPVPMMLTSALVVLLVPKLTDPPSARNVNFAPLLP